MRVKKLLEQIAGRVKYDFLYMNNYEKAIQATINAYNALAMGKTSYEPINREPTRPYIFDINGDLLECVEYIHRCGLNVADIKTNVLLGKSTRYFTIEWNERKLTQFKTMDEVFGLIEKHLDALVRHVMYSPFTCDEFKAFYLRYIKGQLAMQFAIYDGLFI